MQHGLVAKGRTDYLTPELIEQVISQMMEPPAMCDTREEAIAFFAEHHGFDVSAVTEALNTREAVMPKKKVNINEIRRELEKPTNRRVLASVNEESGAVNTYLAPTPPNEGFRLEGNRWVATNIDGVKANVYPDQINPLLEQFNNLVQQHLDPASDQAARAKIKHQLDLTYRALTQSLDLDRADRDHADRAAERGPQTSATPGTASNNSLMEKLAMIRQTMRGIIDNPAST
jgi:hypothetical protein